MATTPNNRPPRNAMPDGFSRDWGDPYGKKDTVSAKALQDGIQLNNDTLKALQTVGRNIDNAIFVGDKSFDEYLKKLGTLADEKKQLELEIQEEIKQNAKVTKAEIALLIKHLSDVTGLQQEQVADQLSDITSEMFKELPKELASSLETLLKSDKKILQTTLKENKDYIESVKKREAEEKEKTKEFFKGILDKADDVFSKNSDSLKSALFGPLNLLISPLEEFFDFDIMEKSKSFLFGNKREGKDNIIKRIFKKRPSVNDVANTGDMGSLLINNTLLDVYGKGKGEGRASTGFNVGDMAEEALGGIISKGLASLVPSIISILPGILGATAVVGGIGLIAWQIWKNRDRTDWDVDEEVGTLYNNGNSALGTAIDDRKAEAQARMAQALAAEAASDPNAANLAGQPVPAPVQIINTTQMTAAQKSALGQMSTWGFIGEGGGRYFDEYSREDLQSGYEAYFKKRYPDQPFRQIFHKGGIIGQDALSNPNQILAQRGEVILPISESNYGLSSGMLKPTPEGGMMLNRGISLPSYNSSAISLSPVQQRNLEQQEEQNTNTNVLTASMEKKFDTMISLLQSLLNKAPVTIQPPKQTGRDLDLLISGGML